MIMSLNAETAFENMEKPLKINSFLLICGIRDIHLRKPVYTKPKSKKAILQTSGTRQSCPLSPELFNIVLEVVD